jgi:3-phenylpropionate/trans-cinnamate dioxygenase ferredoxin reductase subunit
MSGIVIIGAGQAAGQAAASLRQGKYEGSITILGNETQPPYQRPPLSKQYLSGELGMDRVMVRPEKFYADQDIALHTGTWVESIDRAAKSVTTSSSDSYEYDKLLIATGSRPRILTIPGSDLSGIHYLRTIDDVDGIREAMKTAKKICIVGGGYIGLEVTAVAVTAGLQVTVLEMEDRILKRVTTPEMSEYYHQLHAGRGADIKVSTGVSGFQGESHVSTVLCGDEQIDADLVIVGIGIIPNIELAEAAGLNCNNGITVDDHCRTSDPDIYAAGDCTNHPNPTIGRRLRLQMLGFSADGDTSVLRGDKAANQFAVFYLKDGKVVSVDAVNSPKEFMVCKQLYGKTVDPSVLKDTNVELKTLLN